MKHNFGFAGLGKNSFPRKDRRACEHTLSDGFTLIEMMVVLAIITLFVTMTTQVANHVVAANNLTMAGESVQDALRSARHLAMVKDRVVEVRFYKTNDAENLAEKAQIRSMQIFLFDADNLNARPIRRMIKLPGNVVVSDNEKLSSLMAEDRVKNNWKKQDPKLSLPGSGNGYVAYTLRFLPNGGTDLDTQKLWFATLHAAHEAGEPPANYVTVQVKATRGTIRTLRPN